MAVNDKFVTDGQLHKITISSMDGLAILASNDNKFKLITITTEVEEHNRVGWDL